MRRDIIMAAISVMASLTGCYFYGPCIDGSGPVVLEERMGTEFTGIINTGSFEVRVTQSDSFFVEVEAQQNLLPNIETYVSGHSLIIETQDGSCIKSTTPVIVHVSLPVIEEIKLSGSGKILLEGVENNDFECTNSGSGYIDIESISTGLLDVKNSGSGTIFFNEAYAEEVSFVQSGSGTLEAGVIYDALDIEILHSSSGQIKSSLVDGNVVIATLNGSGRILLSGDATDADFTLNSSGRINALDLITVKAATTNTGSGKIYVYATESLEATITGSGNIIYRGNPDISYKITGSGEVLQY